MATIDSLLEQVSKSDLDIASLLRLRNLVDDRITTVRKALVKQLEAVDSLLRGSDDAAPRRGRPRKVNARRRGKNASNSSGKHAGLSVADALRKVIGKGGKMSTAQIKEAFDAAGDRRNLNFTILIRGGVVKRVGFEKKEAGKKGRAGGIYAVA